MKKKLVIAIDDEGGEIIADLIINGTVLDRYHQYPNLARGNCILAGPEFALIRPIFGEVNWKPPINRSVLIVIGSGKRATDWVFFILSDLIDKSEWGEITIVVGKSFPNTKKLEQLCEKVGAKYVNGCSGEKLARIMEKSSVALITGGMVVYEALAVGVPTVVFPQVSNLPPEAEWFFEHGYLINLGFTGGMETKTLEESVKELLFDEKQAVQMSRNQRKTIDGLGMIRAAQAIANKITESKKLSKR